MISNQYITRFSQQYISFKTYTKVSKGNCFIAKPKNKKSHLPEIPGRRPLFMDRITAFRFYEPLIEGRSQLTEWFFFYFKTVTFPVLVKASLSRHKPSR